MKKIINGVVALTLVAAAALAGCSLREPPEGVGSVDQAEGSTRDVVPECSEGESCFSIRADGNITHIFVDVDCDPCGIDVTVDGYPVEKLHDQGGPCHDIERVAWFPLTGNQDRARVCVQTDCPGAAVTIGWKVRGECHETEVICYPGSGEPTEDPTIEIDARPPWIP